MTRTSWAFTFRRANTAAFSEKNTQASGKPFKMAMSFGHDPLTFLAGSIEVPYGVPEYEFIGGIRGEPFEMIEGEYSGLPIPANAEIVIEGDVHFDNPKDRRAIR